jgi:hypothetical protein
MRSFFNICLSITAILSPIYAAEIEADADVKARGGKAQALR